MREMNGAMKEVSLAFPRVCNQDFLSPSRIREGREIEEELGD